jgi:hypothetical protein
LARQPFFRFPKTTETRALIGSRWIPWDILAFYLPEQKKFRVMPRPALILLTSIRGPVFQTKRSSISKARLSKPLIFPIKAGERCLWWTTRWVGFAKKQAKPAYPQK